MREKFLTIAKIYCVLPLFTIKYTVYCNLWGYFTIMTYNIKKYLSLILILCIFASTLLPTFAKFSDTQNHWANSQINTWSELQIITGSDGKFRPNDKITRGEIAIILDRIFKFQFKSSNNFNDLDNSYYTDPLLKCNYADLIKGNNGKIRPKEYISREEVITIFARALQLDIESKKKYKNFKDYKMISSWAIEAVNSMVCEGFVNGDSNNNFNPKSYISRAEVVKILDNCITSLYSKKGTYSNSVTGNVVINSADITLKDMNIDGNLYITQGVSDGDIALVNVKISGNVFINGGGKNSVRITDSTVNGYISINKQNGEIRLVLAGNTIIHKVIMRSGGIIESTEGTINEIELCNSIPKGQKVYLIGLFKLIKNYCPDLEINVDGIIDTLLLFEKSIILGKCKIKKVSSGDNGSTVNGTIIKGTQENIPITTDSAIATNTSNTSIGSNIVPDGSNIVPDGSNIVPDNQPNKIYYSVSFETNGGTNIPSQSILSGSKINLPPEPTKAGYVFMGWFTDSECTSEYNTNTLVNSNIILYAKFNGYKKPVTIDTRFASGYPKFSISEDKKIHLQIKANDATKDNPISVFMLVNQMNSLFDATSEDVIHGHCSAEDGMVEVDEAPYIYLTDSDEHSIETNVRVSGINDIKIYFVIRDKNGYTSPEPTVIDFFSSDNKQDNIPPKFIDNGGYINKELNKITLYFNEAFSETSIPPANSFVINGTNNSAAVNSVNIRNIDSNKAAVELGVSGITDCTNISISYNPPIDGTDLQDSSEAHNRVQSFSDIPVKIVDQTILADNISVSNDGKYMFIKMNFALQDYATYDFSIKKGLTQDTSTTIDCQSSVLRLWSSAGNYHIMFITLDNTPSILPGEHFFISLQPVPTYGTKTIDYAGDEVKTRLEIEAVPSLVPEAGVLPSSITYNQQTNGLYVEFPQNCGLYNESGLFGCCFTLNVNGTQYVLRDKVYYSNGVVVILQKNIPIDMSSIDWSMAKLSYSSAVHSLMDADCQLSYKSGKPYEGFSNISIVGIP